MVFKPLRGRFPQLTHPVLFLILLFSGSDRSSFAAGCEKELAQVGLLARAGGKALQRQGAPRKHAYTAGLMPWLCLWGAAP